MLLGPDLFLTGIKEDPAVEVFLGSLRIDLRASIAFSVAASRRSRIFALSHSALGGEGM